MYGRKTKMERWIGTQSVLISPGTVCSVAASILYSSSSCSFCKPSKNAILFMGDRVHGTGNAVIERLSDIETVASILVSKLGSTVNAWVVEAPYFVGPFAVFKEFLSSFSSTGEPNSYDPRDFPASCTTSLILKNSLEQVGEKLFPGCSLRHTKAESSAEDASSNVSSAPQSIILGFSKGGVVANQLLTELSYLESNGQTDVSNSNVKSISIHQKNLNTENSNVKGKINFIVPSTWENLLKSVQEFHYVDVGLNTPGAYQTNESIIQGIGNAAMSRETGLRIVLHGTPRQWDDRRRPWISLEKDILLALLQKESRKYSDKIVKVCEKLYFADEMPSLQMHFEIIDKLDLS